MTGLPDTPLLRLSIAVRCAARKPTDGLAAGRSTACNLVESGWRK